MVMRNKTVAVIGTLDTKGEEYQYLREQIEANGVSTLLVDVGVFGARHAVPDITAEEVARAGGTSLQQLADRKERGEAVRVMGQGAAAIVKKLHEQGKIDGVIAMGGGNGTTLGTTVMKALPIGVPKVMVSTLASGNTRNYVGETDIVMMPSIVDIAGINRFSAEILANAAGAIAGMVKAVKAGKVENKPLVAATMFGVTTPCLTKAKEVLEAAGYEVLIFHASGTGGRSMEQLIRAGFIEGVLDITTTELADELAGGILSAGAERLEAAGEMGIPQVVSAGALDMVNFGPMHTVPEKYKNRKLHAYNPMTTLMRTSLKENKKLGKIIAEKLNKSAGPVTFMMPLGGVSSLDMAGQPLHDPEANAAFLQALKSELSERIELVEIDANINDEQFAIAAANRLIDSIRERKEKK
jgi:Uncharacterized conserved protein